jgi:aminomethyltransferase
MCLPSGGIVDDCIVYRRAADHVLVVVNASNIEKDLAWMKEQAAALCDVVDESDAVALLAVQGPKAVDLVSLLARRPVNEIPSFHHVVVDVGGVSCLVARTGYTGEDGFELACESADAVRLWRLLLEAGRDAGIQPCGLGARDTLRLEARLCLYGNDIDETTTPYEAGLGWVVKLDAGDFVGKAALAKQKAEGVSRKLVGFTVKGRGIARHDYPLLDPSGKHVGKVTSGTTSPTLGVPIGMGYVPTALAEPGGSIQVECRGKIFPVELVKGPFYKRSNG